MPRDRWEAARAMSQDETTQPPASDPAARRPPRSPREALHPELPPPPPPRSRHSRHPLVIVLNFLLTMALLAVLAIGGLLYWGKLVYEEPGPLAEGATVIIPTGSTLDTIADSLDSRGVIANRWVFVGASLFYGTASRLKAGEYVFPANATMRQVMDTIISGRSVQHAITIPEGLTSAQIVDRLNTDPILVGSVAEIPPEGALLPETYKFTRGTTRREILDRMAKAQQEAVAEIWARRTSDLPIATPEELVVLASIVEKETGRADERTRVAGVFVNRLGKKMKLQSDPTILYGIYGSASWQKPRTILRSDMQRPNPYNTYQIDGLPPGPIANPGRDSLEAVANPSRTNDLYFVADGTGGHVFAATIDEHNKNVARWRQIEQDRQNAAPPAGQSAPGGQPNN
jgi:UPF0755 protein